MDEYQELLKDYKDCNDYLKNVDNYKYEDLSIWTLEKFNYWISKDEKYSLSITIGTIPPKNNREKAINSLINFKVVLEKIALIKGIKLN